MVNLPTKWLIQGSLDPASRKSEVSRQIERFDQMHRSIKVPTMLLERLKKEFDLNFKLSGVIS